MTSETHTLPSYEHVKHIAAKPLECCLHGQKCSVALKTTFLKKFTECETLINEASQSEREIPSSFKLQHEKTREQSNMKRYYIGVVTSQTAELFVSRNTAFRVYHSMDEIKKASLRLSIVYKNSCGDFYHFPIKERFDENLRTDVVYVDCGDEECPEFIDLEALIKYYCIYASLQSFSSSRGVIADVFPWWHMVDKT